MSQGPLLLTDPFDLRVGARLLANMLIDLIDGNPALVAEVSHEHDDHACTPEQTGVHLHPAIDVGAGAPQPGEHRAAICTPGQGAGTGLAIEVDSGVGPGSGDVGRTECGPRGLQDLGGGRLDGSGRSSVCAGSVSAGTFQPRLASTAGVVRVDAHLGDRRRRLLRPCRLQRRTAARPEGHDGPSRTAFLARAPPGRQAEQGTQG